MPLYEYRCKKCGRKIEVIQKFSDQPLTRCEECGGELEKLFSAPAIRFKGPGWYVNDYAGKKPKPEKSASDPEKSKSGPGDKDKKETSVKASGENKSNNKPKVA